MPLPVWFACYSQSGTAPERWAYVNIYQLFLLYYLLVAHLFLFLKIIFVILSSSGPLVLIFYQIFLLYYLLVAHVFLFFTNYFCNIIFLWPICCYFYQLLLLYYLLVAHLFLFLKIIFVILSSSGPLVLIFTNYCCYIIF